VGTLASKVLLVKPDGSITPPALPGIKPTDVTVENLGLSEAAQRIGESYPLFTVIKTKKTIFGGSGIVVERGTVDQLLNP
jgi:hypothetical protein